MSRVRASEPDIKAGCWRDQEVCGLDTGGARRSQPANREMVGSGDRLGDHLCMWTCVHVESGVARSSLLGKYHCLSPAAQGFRVCVCACAAACKGFCSLPATRLGLQSWVYICTVRMCAYWEHTLILDAGRTWGQGAEASPLSGYRIWKLLTNIQ